MPLTEQKFTFGKYQGWKIDTVRLCDPQYIVWLHDFGKMDSETRKIVSLIYKDCVSASNKKNLRDEPEVRKPIVSVVAETSNENFNYTYGGHLC